VLAPQPKRMTYMASKSPHCFERSNEHDLHHLPVGSHCASCWPDMTQASGGILDWCLAGKGVKLAAANGYTEFQRTSRQWMVLITGPCCLSSSFDRGEA
jgi:hypothetical protein